MAGDGVIQKDLHAFECLMKISTLRGQDGTGIFQGNFRKNRHKNTFIIEKQPVEVNSFFRWCESKEGNKLVLGSVYDNVFIGHTRWATKGELSKDNCHPFHYKDIIGVHNGTLKELKYQDKIKVDSALFYEDVANRGIKNVLEDMDYESAYALSFFDITEQKLYFVRNERRLLFFCNNTERDVAYWASEADMLEFALSRNNIKFTDPVYFKTGLIYSLSIEEISNKKQTFHSQSYELPKKVESQPVKHIAHNKKKTQKDYENIFGIPWYSEEDHKITKTSMETPRNNIVHLYNDSNADIDKVITKNHKIPHVSCCICHRELSLVEQYFAEYIEIDKGIYYECSDCTVLFNEDNKGIERKALQ